MPDEPKLRLDENGRVILDHNDPPTHLTAHAIQACNLCDPDGLRAGFPCDHIDRTETTRRGIAAVRAALTPKTRQNDPTGPTPDDA